MIMGKIVAKWNIIKEAVGTDENLVRARRGIIRGGKALPGATGRYLVQKVPVVQWIPNYMPKWIVNDAVAGLTVGVLLIPQALAYAALAGIPLQQGLLASWLPSAIYFIMGTSKDISTGPTSVIGLLTGQVITTTGTFGFKPIIITPLISFSVGILSLLLGIFKLGWLLDFISLPVLTGFIMGAALIIIQSQIPTLLGEVAVSPVFIQQGKDIFLKIKTAQPLTFAIGFSGIIMLLIMQFIGKKWGKRNTAAWIVGISKNAIVLILYTGISFGVNKNLEKPLWAVTGEIPSGLQAPKVPEAAFLPILLQLSFPVFIAAALEHISIAKSFGRRNGYTIDQSQELVFLGVANFTNGIFGGMPVGGAISRTSVNSESGVKSPLSGIFTTFIVLLGLYKLTGALFWIPEATLAAVIIVAVINIIPPMSVFIKYWKTSFADFLASFLTLQLTLIASAEQGLGFGVFFMVFYTIIRTVFAHARPVTRADLENQYGADLPSSNESNHIPSGTQVMAFNQAIIFLNAYRVKQDIIDTVQTYHSGIPESGETKEISWSDLETKHIAFLRRRAQFKLPTKLIPRIRVLILDFSRVAFIDTTGLQMLMDLRTEILAYGGEEVEFRFVGLSREVKKKFKRVGWELANSADMQKGFADKGMDTVYELLRPAIEAPRMVRDSGLDFGFGNNLMTGWNNDEGNKVEDRVIVTQITMRDGKAYKE